MGEGAREGKLFGCCKRTNEQGRQDRTQERESQCVCWSGSVVGLVDEPAIHPASELACASVGRTNRWCVGRGVRRGVGLGGTYVLAGSSVCLSCVDIPKSAILNSPTPPPPHTFPQPPSPQPHTHMTHKTSW